MYLQTKAATAAQQSDKRNVRHVQANMTGDIISGKEKIYIF